MSTDRQRDADLDRLLRAELRRDGTAKPGACPDAGMLAAWVEGGVTGEERIALDAHLAACGRCQDTLAAMDLETPLSPVAAPAAAERRPWLWRGHLHWLIPAAAAGVLVLYLAAKPAIAPYFPPVRPVPESQMADARTPQAPPAAPSFASESAPLQGKGERAGEVGTMAQRAVQDAADLKKPAEQVVAQSAGVAPPAGMNLGAPPAARTVPAAALPAPAVAPPPTVVVTGAAPPLAGSGLAVSADASKTGAAGAAAGAVGSTQSKGAVAATVANAPSRGAASDRLFLASPTEFFVVAAPGGQVQWRVGPEGAIWRSADEGKTWYPQKSGVKSALLAAAAPSASTCWAVGADGTVLLTDTGERWERRPFPEQADLVMVEARSARDATVTTRDGRRFTTADGGATWTPQRNSR